MQSDTSKLLKTNDRSLKRKCHTALHYAAENYQLTEVENLVKAGADVSTVAFDGTTPLHLAVMSGSFEVMRHLIERGANLHCRDNLFDFSLVHLAALVADNRKLALLVEQGLDVNDANANNVTALHLAALTGNAELVAELIKRGANVNCCDKNWKYAPLHLAAMMGCCVNLKEFIVEKSDPEFERDEDEVRSNLIVRCYEILKRRESVRVDYESVVKTLVKAKAIINCLDFRGRAPLHFATQRPTNGITEMLLAFGALADVRDYEGHYPVQNLIERRNFDGLCYLLRYGADFDNVISISPFTYRWLRCHMVPDRIDRYIDQYLIKLTEVGFRSYADRLFYILPRFSEKVKSQIKEEAVLLRQFYVEDKVSAYDVIHMNYRRRATFYYKLPFADLKQKLPLFRSVIRGRCRQAFDKVWLMRVANPAWDSITGIKWPAICTEMIFSYLTNADIVAFVVAEQKMRQCLQNQQPRN